MRTVLSLEALQVLDMIERQGSFAAAAEALHRVPSAVTYAMQKLEQDLGVTLFKKAGRRSQLTAAGRVLLEQGRELLEVSHQLAETVRQVERGWESRLVIAVDSLLPFDRISAALQSFLQMETGTEIRLREEVLFGSWEALLDKRADLIVGAPALEQLPTGVELRQLASVEFVFAVAAGHPLAALSKPLTIDDIKPYRNVVVSDSVRRRSALSRRVYGTQPVLAVSNIEQKIEAQSLGLGVGFLPLSRIEPHLHQGRLVCPQLSWQEPPQERYLAWRSEDEGRALQWFSDWFEQNLA